MMDGLELVDSLSARAEAIWCDLERGAHPPYFAGSARYKASLATGATQLVWLRVQRTHLRFAIEQRVRDWKHAIVGAFA
jgi:hypothetical protein